MAHEVPRYTDVCRLGGAAEKATPLTAKLRTAVRLACLTYESDETIRRWEKGESVSLVDSKMCYGAKFDKAELYPIKVTLQGKDALGNYHKAQWLAGHCGNVLYIAFKGSSSATDFILDSSLSDQVTPTGMRTHSGFYSGVQQELLSILEVCNRETKFGEIVFCGHSLGGAYSIVAMMEICAHILFERDAKTCEAITFGAPLTVSADKADSPANLPSELALAHPPITNVVANYDIVPRLLAMTLDTASKFMQEVPGVMNSALHTMVGMAKRAGMFNTEHMMESIQHLRECFRPMGTYLVAQTGVVQGVRRTTAAILQPDRVDEIFEALRYMPGLDPTEEAKNRVDFVRDSINDHSMANSYWPIVEQLCASIEGSDSTPITRLVDTVEHSVSSMSESARRKIDDHHLRSAIEAYEPRDAMGLSFPNEGIMKELPPADREAWWRLREEMCRLTRSTGEARDRALARMPPVELEKQETAEERELASACLVAEAVQKIAVPDKEKSSLSSRFTSAFSKDLKQPTPFLVNFVDPPQYIELSVGKKFKAIVQPKEAVSLEGCSARDTLFVTLGDKRSEITIPDATSSETRVLVVERSGVLGLMIHESALRSSEAGSWNPFAKAKAGEDVVKRVDIRMIAPSAEARERHLHTLSYLLQSMESTHTVQVSDAVPLGVGIDESMFDKADHCRICATKLSSGPMGTHRHHCRACGSSVCQKCSPDTVHLFTYGVTPVRACASCVSALAVDNRDHTVSVVSEV